MDLERLLNYRREGEIDQAKGRKCLCPWVLKALKLQVPGMTEAGREFQLLEIIGAKILANEVVSHFSNLTTKGVWESANRVLLEKQALGRITTHQSTYCDSIYKGGKARNHFFDKLAS